MVWIYLNIIGMCLIFFLIIYVRRRSEAKRFSQFNVAEKDMPVEPSGNFYEVLLESNASDVVQTNRMKLVADQQGVWLIKERMIKGWYYYLLKYSDITNVELMTQDIFRARIYITHNNKDIVSPFKLAVNYSAEKLYEDIRSKI